MSQFQSALRKGLFLAIGLLGTATGYYGTKQIQDAAATNDWPTIDGKIVTSEIQPATKESPERPFVRFEYSLRGTIYRSSQYRQGVAGNTFSKAAAEELIKKYPVGKQVQVHYDPYNPGNSVIEGGDPTVGYLLCSVAVILFGGGALLALRLRKKK
jgi:hypothetical protein